ncbi:MAG: toxin-antitoxin system YwqK family antitoxin [Cyclobacteriaceae bacterium]
MERHYDNDGNITFEVPIKDNLYEGVSKQYYPSGQLQLESRWEKGTKNGVSKSYYANGALSSIEFYEEGVANGVFQYFDSTGTLMEEVTVKNGVFDGRYLSYFPNGIIEIDAVYKKGEQYGKALYYNQLGKLRRVIFHEDTIRYDTEYDENGNIISSEMPLIFASSIVPEGIILKMHLDVRMDTTSRYSFHVGMLSDDKQYLIDTFDSVYDMDTISYSFSLENIPGIHQITGLFSEIGDSLVYGRIPVTYEYTIVPGSD